MANRVGKWLYLAAGAVVAVIVACTRYFFLGKKEGAVDAKFKVEKEHIEEMQKHNDTEGLRDDILKRIK